MAVQPARLVTTAAILLIGCHQSNSATRTRSVVGRVCAAQSQCGRGERCVYRGKDLMSKSLVVRQGVCEPKRWPAGCYALLPPTKNPPARKQSQGEPVRVCE